MAVVVICKSERLTNLRSSVDNRDKDCLEHRREQDAASSAPPRRRAVPARQRHPSARSAECRLQVPPRGAERVPARHPGLSAPHLHDRAHVSGAGPAPHRARGRAYGGCRRGDDHGRERLPGPGTLLQHPVPHPHGTGPRAAGRGEAQPGEGPRVRRRTPADGTRPDAGHDAPAGGGAVPLAVRRVRDGRRHGVEPARRARR